MCGTNPGSMVARICSLRETPVNLSVKIALVRESRVQWRYCSSTLEENKIRCIPKLRVERGIGHMHAHLVLNGAEGIDRRPFSPVLILLFWVCGDQNACVGERQGGGDRLPDD